MRELSFIRFGSPEVVAIARGELGKIRKIDGTFVLRRRGMSMSDAKRAIDEILDQGRVVVEVPTVESVEVFSRELRAAGFTPTFPSAQAREARERVEVGEN